MVSKPPRFDEQLGIGQAGEPVDIEALVAKTAVEALDEGVLDGLAGVDELQLDLLLIGPVIEHPARQFRSVVEHLDHAYPWKRGSDLDGCGFAGAGIEDRQHPQPAPRGQGVTDEVETLAVIRTGADDGAHPTPDRQAFPFAVHDQPFLPIETVDPLVIHVVSLPS